jgi:hypothetical protein
MQAVGGTINTVENVADGKYGAAILDGVGVLGNVALMTRACFTCDMQVLTRRGWVRWDELRVGDEVACCDENNPYGTIEYRPVEELFVTRAPIWHVQVQGRLIRTTSDHRIFVWGKDWVAARRLEAGDRLRSADGQEVAVEGVFDTGLEETVYNCRVQDYSTYFVGGEDWGFSVWAHNVCIMNEQLQESLGPLGKRVIDLAKNDPSQRGVLSIVRAMKQDGSIVDIVVNSSRRMVSPAVRDAMSAGEIAIKGTLRHAETSGLLYAARQGWQPLEVAASIPICQRCANWIRRFGAIPVSPLA